MSPSLAPTVCTKSARPVFSPSVNVSVTTTSSPIFAAPVRIPSPGPVIGLTPPKLVAGFGQVVPAGGFMPTCSEHTALPAWQTYSPRSACGTQSTQLRPSVTAEDPKFGWSLCGGRIVGPCGSRSSQDGSNGVQDDDVSTLPSLVHL